MHIEHVERQALSDRQVVAVMLAAGAEKIEMPTLDDARAEFDAALAAEPEPESSNARLLRELEVG